MKPPDLGSLFQLCIALSYQYHEGLSDYTLLQLFSPCRLQLE
jgi:hypothetical protein